MTFVFLPVTSGDIWRVSTELRFLEFDVSEMAILESTLEMQKNKPFS